MPFRSRRWLFRTLRHAAPIAAALALLLVLTDGDAALDRDLQLVVPATWPSSAHALPIRALLYTQLRASEGPRMVREPVNVRLETGKRVLARARLLPAQGEIADVEGTLVLPPELAAGAYRIVAEATHDGYRLHASAPFRISASAAPVPLEGRPLRALQQFSAGPTRGEHGQQAPSALTVQVRGGACVPEQRCELRVHVGDPAAALSVEPNSTTTPAPDAARPGPVSAGVVALDVTTHGPEAELWLRAWRGPERVASRAVRLPVALAAVRAELSALVVMDSHALRVSGSAADGGCLVDAFSAGVWRKTGSLARCAGPNGLPFTLEPGLWRLQLRRDVFSSDTAGVAAVYVQRSDETLPQVVSALALEALSTAPEDPFARACRAEPTRCTDPPALQYLAAWLETGLASLPRALSGYADTIGKLRERRARMRSLAVCALVLGGLGLALSVGRTGLHAGVRASQLLDAEPHAARLARMRSLGVVVASVAALLLVFVVLALYVLARGGGP